MSYYFAKAMECSFSEAIERAKEGLKSEGFGVMCEIDVQKVLNDKLGADFYPYTILGACNPSFSYRAFLTEDKIGLMLPCNLIVQEPEPGQVEVSAVDPIESMSAVDNPALLQVALEVQGKLKSVIEGM